MHSCIQPCVSLAIESKPGINAMMLTCNTLNKQRANYSLIHNDNYTITMPNISSIILLFN